MSSSELSRSRWRFDGFVLTGTVDEDAVATLLVLHVEPITWPTLILSGDYYYYYHYYYYYYYQHIREFMVGVNGHYDQIIIIIITHSFKLIATYLESIGDEQDVRLRRLLPVIARYNG